MSTNATAPRLTDASIRPAPRCQRYRVAGMSCSHCERAVEREVLGLPGVRGARANAADGTLVIEGLVDVAPEDVATAVDEAGYELVLA